MLGTLNVDVDDRSLTGKYVIPIMDVKFPPGAGYRRDVESHDFALMVLQHPAKWSDKGGVTNNIYPSINFFFSAFNLFASPRSGVWWHSCHCSRVGDVPA